MVALQQLSGRLSTQLSALREERLASRSRGSPDRVLAEQRTRVTRVCALGGDALRELVRLSFLSSFPPPVPPQISYLIQQLDQANLERSTQEQVYTQRMTDLAAEAQTAQAELAAASKRVDHYVGMVAGLETQLREARRREANLASTAAQAQREAESASAAAAAATAVAAAIRTPPVGGQAEDEDSEPLPSPLPPVQQQQPTAGGGATPPSSAESGQRKQRRHRKHHHHHHHHRRRHRRTPPGSSGRTTSTAREDDSEDRAGSPGSGGGAVAVAVDRSPVTTPATMGRVSSSSPTAAATTSSSARQQAQQPGVLTESTATSSSANVQWRQSQASTTEQARMVMQRKREFSAAVEALKASRLRDLERRIQAAEQSLGVSQASKKG